MTTTTTAAASNQSSNNYCKLSKSDTHQIAGLYDLEETIGQGHFAVVKLARHVFTGEKVAIKVIDKTKLDQISREHLFQEVRCMKLVQHPNVVRLYEVIDTTTKLYLILELGDGGDMYDYIMRHTNGLSESKARNYFKQILRAIKYCHDLHVVHRDLKPENVVFFEQTGEVKLTDFGFSNIFQPGKKLTTSCGSLAYSAPEILLGDSYDAPAVDVWSLGVILYMLVTGHAPFQEANDSETLTMILDCKYYLPPDLSSECKTLISRMLVREPENRILLGEIWTHEWLTSDEEVKKSLERDNEVPLVKRKLLSDHEQNEVINNMIKGNIATRDEILKAIKEDNYNYITATYYLLAERILKRHNALTNQSSYKSSKNHQPSKGSLSKNTNQPPQATTTTTTTATKRKLKKSLAITDVELNENDEELTENKSKKKIDSEPNSSESTKSPSKLKTNEAHIEEEEEGEEEDVLNSITTTVSSSNRRATGRQELLSFAILEEETEEGSLVEVNKENDSSKSSGKQHYNNNNGSSNHLLKEINEEGESDGDIDEEVLVVVTGGDNNSSELFKQPLQQVQTNGDNKQLSVKRNRIKKNSISASSTDDDTDAGTDTANQLTNEEIKEMRKQLREHHKRSSLKKTHQSRVRPVSISDMSGNEESATGNSLNSYKSTAIRAKSVESNDLSPFKPSGNGNSAGASATGNDLAPPLNYNLKSLSIEHRLANISQMSISSQLSKTNSIRHNSRSGACDTPVQQHVHSTTPTPRESIVFNRGDEKPPIAKILLQHQQQHQLNKLAQQQQQSASNGAVPSAKSNDDDVTNENQSNSNQEPLPHDEQQQKPMTPIDNHKTNKLNSPPLVNHRPASIQSFESNDSDLSEYENTLKSNKTLINNSSSTPHNNKSRNLNDSYNNAIVSTTVTTTTTTTLLVNDSNSTRKASTHSIPKKSSKTTDNNNTTTTHHKCCCIL